MNNLLYEPLTFGVPVASRCEGEDMLKHNCYHSTNLCLACKNLKHNKTKLYLLLKGEAFDTILSLLKSFVINMMLNSLPFHMHEKEKLLVVWKLVLMKVTISECSVRVK